MAQLNLFGGSSTSIEPRERVSVCIAGSQSAPCRTRPGAAKEAPRLVTVDDMPEYPSDIIEAVESALAEVPADTIWFTYRDVEKHFGISRSTTARRLKQGLVPGIRFQHGRMLDDGPVRRLDRRQLRWLLLAVRMGRAS